MGEFTFLVGLIFWNFFGVEGSLRFCEGNGSISEVVVGLTSWAEEDVVP